MVRLLDRLDVKPRALCVHTAVGNRNQSSTYDLGQLFEQYRPCLAGVDAPAAGRKAYGHSGLDVFWRDDHRGAGEDDLGRPLYLDPAAPSRAPVPAHDAPDGLLDAPCQEIFEGDLAYRVREQIWTERIFSGPNANQRRRGERVPLYPVYKENERSKVVGAGEVLIGSVSLAVDAVERCAEVLHF